MVIYALDRNNQRVSIWQARKGEAYRCLECQGAVRLRGGLFRFLHFYHLRVDRDCRSKGKGVVHQQVQLYFLQHLKGEGSLEVRFPEIDRIADVVWERQKLVFEIQCSPISLEEVKGRSADYQSLGYRVVWILHDSYFNQRRLTSAEVYLRGRCHYFTNINRRGVGGVYDQLEVLQGSRRRKYLKPFVLDPFVLEAMPQERESWPALIRERGYYSNVYFKGDLLDKYLAEGSVRKAIRELEEAATFEAQGRKKGLKEYLREWPKRAYLICLQILLRKFTKN